MISVCVLSFNRPERLSQTIRSMHQTATEPFELIVHDDGSAGPRTMLLEMMAGGMISHLMLNPPGHNEGQGVAVNRMFAVAKGNILVKCDQDLIFKPGWMEAIHAAFEESEGRGVDPGAPQPNRIGCLGLFRYDHPPVRHREMLIAERETYSEVKDFVGSLIAVPRIVWERLGPWEEHRPSFDEDYRWKRMVTEIYGICCAVTNEDFVENVGFGIGPSTIVLGGGQVQEIKSGPRLVGPESEV